MIGGDYLNKLGRNLNSRLKKLAGPLLKDGIGDKMDKGNLWIVPGFTILAFAILWCTKLSKLALEESSCMGISPYHLTGSLLDIEAQRHCQTSKRYFVGINEPFSYEPSWREARQVKNPEWVLWFWLPIAFVMYVITRYLWSLLMENQGINFSNIVNASQSVMVDNDGVSEIDMEKLDERIQVVADNFRCASSSNAFAAFIAFEFVLVIAPLFLLLVALPLMIGGSYRTWGLDVARAWWEKKEWQGTPIPPLFGSSHNAPLVPLIPRISYCDYHFITLANDHVVTYRCYLDATWHERTALFTWIMLLFLAFINLCNLFFWILWACRMSIRSKRQKWVSKKWLNGEDFGPETEEYLQDFASQFKMGNLLLFYYIEAHTDRVVASAFAMELFKNWTDKNIGKLKAGAFVVKMQKPTIPRPNKPKKEPFVQPSAPGWKSDSQNWDSEPQNYENPPAFGNTQGFGNESWNDSQGWDNPEPTCDAQIPTNLYTTPPSTSDTVFSSDNFSQAPLIETPKRTSTPVKKGKLYDSNIKQASYTELEPLNNWKRRRSDKRKKQDTQPNSKQAYYCSVM